MYVYNMMVTSQVAKTKETQEQNISQVIENKQVIHSEESKLSAIEPAKILPSSGQKISEEIVLVENSKIKSEMSNLGGVIKSVEIKKYGYRMPVVDVFGLSEYSSLPFSVTKKNGNSISYLCRDSNLEIEKRYDFSDDTDVLTAAISIKNVSGAPIIKNLSINSFSIDTSRLDNIVDPERDISLFEYSVYSGNMAFRRGNAYKFTIKDTKKTSGMVKWIGFRNRYYAIFVKPESQAKGYQTDFVNEKRLKLSIDHDDVAINPGEVFTYSAKIYVGPQDLKLLKSYKQGFEDIMVFSNFSPIDWVSKLILNVMHIIYKVIPNWGIAIILVSTLVFLAMYPLTFHGMKSMKKMQAIQPKMAQLREQHKNNPQKMNKEVMELYKQYNVNPFSGCLPFLLQMPVFIALYQALWRSVEFKGAPFLWIKDLSEPDRLFVFAQNLPIIGNEFNLLPLLMAVVMYFQQKISMKSMSSADPNQVLQQKIMLVFFPIFLGFIFYKFSSGLSLYFTVFYLLSTVSQWKMSKMNFEK